MVSPSAPSPQRGTGSHVPYDSLVELRAAYMPDVARNGPGIPRADPEGSAPQVLTSPKSLFDTSAVVYLRSPLSTVPVGTVSWLLRNAHHHGS